MSKQKIIIGADHAGFDLKEKVIEWLNSHQFEVVDVGTYSIESTDYPDYAHKAAKLVGEEKGQLGVLICGSANGVCMSANKHAEVRAALCWLPEIAALARQHNDANICCLPARFISEEMALEITETFLNNDFEGGRHSRRVNKIAQC
jgi:ribose 5-phosphate isomerase B